VAAETASFLKQLDDEDAARWKQRREARRLREEQEKQWEALNSEPSHQEVITKEGTDMKEVLFGA
jgi:7-keto-8-aminopelargonate synthetase-like enzyme